MSYNIVGNNYELHFPDSWDECAESEMPSKGYLSGAWIELSNGRRSQIFFFDPVRLQQELEIETRLGRPVVAETGMIVVPEVTRESIRSAIELLIEDGYFEPSVQFTQHDANVLEPA